MSLSVHQSVHVSCAVCQSFVCGQPPTLSLSLFACFFDWMWIGLRTKLVKCSLYFTKIMAEELPEKWTHDSNARKGTLWFNTMTYYL